MSVITLTRSHHESVTILRDLPRFRYLWLSKAISSAGTGVGRIALVLFVAPSGPGAVSLVLIGAALPLLASPLAGAVADRVDQRRLLADTAAGLRYTAGNTAIRGLALGTFVFVTFAAVDNVALVFLVRQAPVTPPSLSASTPRCRNGFRHS